MWSRTEVTTSEGESLFREQVWQTVYSRAMKLNLCGFRSFFWCCFLLNEVWETRQIVWYNTNVQRCCPRTQRGFLLSWSINNYFSQRRLGLSSCPSNSDVFPGYEWNFNSRKTSQTDGRNWNSRTFNYQSWSQISWKVKWSKLISNFLRSKVVAVLLFFLHIVVLAALKFRLNFVFPCQQDTNIHWRALQRVVVKVYLWPKRLQMLHIQQGIFSQRKVPKQQ